LVAALLENSNPSLLNIVGANSGVITGSLMSILGAEILIAGLLALKVERTKHDH
jgi:hypothetical protein